MGLDYQEVYKLVEGKMEPILQRVEREYQTTEEYKAVTHRRQIQAAYQKAKAAFAKKYGVDEREYDVCYNVFGEVMNQPYLDQIIESFRAYRSYYDSSGVTTIGAGPVLRFFVLLWGFVASGTSLN